MKTILVTGGNGLVGHAIQDISNNYPEYHFLFLNSKVCNLTDYSETLILFMKII